MGKRQRKRDRTTSEVDVIRDLQDELRDEIRDAYDQNSRPNKVELFQILVEYTVAMSRRVDMPQGTISQLYRDVVLITNQMELGVEKTALWQS